MTPDLSYYWEGARESCEDNIWDKKREKRELVSPEALARRLAVLRVGG